MAKILHPNGEIELLFGSKMQERLSDIQIEGLLGYDYTVYYLDPKSTDGYNCLLTACPMDSTVTGSLNKLAHAILQLNNMDETIFGDAILCQRDSHGRYY